MSNADITTNKIEIVNMARKHLRFLTHLEHMCFSLPWSFSSLEAELAKEKSIFLVALKDAKQFIKISPSIPDFCFLPQDNKIIMGYIGMQTVCDEGYITNLAVFPLFRKLGVGRKLLQAILNKAKEQHLKFVSLEVRVSNIPAIRLYKSEGFVILGKRKKFYTSPSEDALIMTNYIDNTKFLS
jgi:ribosomal-protein-alanine N-acetyltransferase